MASYRITALPEAHPSSENLRNQIRAHSAFDCDEQYQYGTIPDTFATTPDGCCWVVYAQERTDEKETLDGKETITVAEKYTVFFLGNGYAAYEYRTQDVEDEILSFVGSTFDAGVRLEPVIFDETALRQVIDQSETVRRVDVAPSRQEAPDRVTGLDRMDLRQTDWWPQNTGEPFAHIKVDLPTENAEFDLGFNDCGKIILYGKKIDHSRQAQVLQYVTSEIIDTFVDLQSFQSNNWF